MLAGLPISDFLWNYASSPVPQTSGTQQGVSFTSGSDPSEAASWTQLISGANCTYDIWATWLYITNFNANNNARQCVLDVGVDGAGGSSYTEVISEFTCGTAGDANSGGRHFWFPLFIKSGSSVGVRFRSTGNFVGYVGAVFFGRPMYPERTWTATYTETIGKSTGVLGTTLAGATPVGVSGAQGTPQSLGSSTKKLQFFQLGAQVNDTSSSPRQDFWDVFAGTGTSMSIDAVIRNWMCFQVGSTEYYGHGLYREGCYRTCPAGTTFYARAGTDIATADSSYNCTLLGFGRN